MGADKGFTRKPSDLTPFSSETLLVRVLKGVRGWLGELQPHNFCYGEGNVKFLYLYPEQKC